MTENENNEADAELFRNAVQDVKKLNHNLAEISPSRSVIPSTRRPHVPQVEETEAATEFAKPGLQRTVLRKLRTGLIPIEGELDLHGSSVNEAQQRVEAFLLHSQVAGRQSAVRIIHGKGHRSADGRSVLKQKVYEWLRQSESVLACSVADPAGGGSGAVHVLLKRR